MKRRHTSPSVRRATRVFPQLLTADIAIGSIILLLSYVRLSVRPPQYRESLLLTGEPVRILSVSPAGSVLVLTVPADTVIRAVNGYGSYSVKAVSELDRLDGKGGTLLTASVSDALGIPISHYIGQSPASGNDAVALVRQTFSWGSLISRLRGAVAPSVPVADWLRHVLTLGFIPADKVETVDLAQAVVNQTAADGSVARILDESKLDYMLSTALFDTGLRGEGYTVAVYNTTNIPTVGQRAARMLSRMGLQLVFVGNADHATETCQVAAEPDALSSKTVAFIGNYFGCSAVGKDSVSIGGGTGADVVVLLGKRFASQYE